MIGRKIITQFLGVSLSSFLSFLTLSLTARFFGAQILGDVNYFLAILGILLIFSDFGFSRAHVKFIADKKKIREKMAVFLSIKLTLLFIFLIGALFYLFFFLRHTSADYKIFAFIILMLYEFFNRIGSSILLIFEGLQIIAVQNFIMLITKLIKLGTIILAFLCLKNLLGLSLSYLTEGFSFLILAIFYAKKYFVFSFKKDIFYQYFYYSLPFFIIYPLTYIQGNIDVVILKNFWNSSTVGYYSAAISLTAFLKTLYGVLITLFFPKISQLYAKNDLNKIQEYTNLTVKYLLVIFTPLFLGFYFFKNEFIFLTLGKEFSPSVTIFSLSLVGIIILMISSPYDHILYATGRHKILAPLTILTVGLTIILQLILVPKSLFSISLFGLGGSGAVLANLTAWFLSAIVKIYLVYRYFKIKPQLKSFYILIFAFLAVIIFRQEQIFIGKLLYLMLILSIFYIFIRTFRIIQSADVKYAKLVFNPIKIVQQIKQELINEK